MSLANAYNAKRKVHKMAKGVHKPIEPKVGSTGKDGESKAGDEARWAQATSEMKNTSAGHLAKAKAEHHEVLSEMRSMPKPKIQGLAHGGKVHGGVDHEKGVHKPGILPESSEAGSFIKGGYSGVGKRKHQEVLAELKSMPKPNIKGLAFGGDVESEDMVDQIMRKHKMAFEPEHDEPAHPDEVESFDEEDPGEELGEHDMISKIMRKRK